MGSTEGDPGPESDVDQPDPQAYTEKRLSAARRLEQENSPPSVAGDELNNDDSDHEQTTTEKDEDSESALRAVELRLRNARVANEEQDLNLRRMVAKWSIGFVCAQLVAANLFFGWYLFFNRVNPDGRVMIMWLASSVVEVIGIVAVIARSLFPGNKRKSKSRKANGNRVK